MGSVAQGGNSGLVLLRGQGGEAADTAPGHDSRLRDGNGVGIFAGLIQSLSEKTEGIPPTSLIFGQDCNPKHSCKKMSQGIFLQSLLKLGRFLITPQSPYTGLRGKVNAAFHFLLLWREKRSFELPEDEK